MIFGGANDIEAWSQALVDREPEASEYGKLHLDYAAAYRQTQMASSVLDAVTATFLLRGEKANSVDGRAVLFQFRGYLCTFDAETHALDGHVARLLAWVQDLLDRLQPENRKTVVEALFRLAAMGRASISWLITTVSGVVRKLKIVHNSNFGKAVRLLNEADPPPQRGGRRRAQVTEIKYEPSAKVSGSSIQTSSFV